MHNLMRGNDKQQDRHGSGISAQGLKTIPQGTEIKKLPGSHTRHSGQVQQGGWWHSPETGTPATRGWDQATSR